MAFRYVLPSPSGYEDVNLTRLEVSEITIIGRTRRLAAVQGVTILDKLKLEYRRKQQLNIRIEVRKIWC
jgi:hypothetical protein